MNNTMFREFATPNFVTMNDVMNKLFERQLGSYDYTRNGGSANNGSANGNAQSNGQPSAANNVPATTRLPLDVQATEEAFLFTAYLPGVTPESVEITFEKDELTIKGQFPQKDDGNHYIKSELFHGAFERKLTFNTAVNADSIEANFENGVLSLRVPKTEEAKPKKIAVSVK